MLLVCDMFFYVTTHSGDVRRRSKRSKEKGRKRPIAVRTYSATHVDKYISTYIYMWIFIIYETHTIRFFQCDISLLVRMVFYSSFSSSSGIQQITLFSKKKEEQFYFVFVFVVVVVVVCLY